MLLFVEDPGALNYMRELPAGVAEQGIPVVFAAGGTARRMLDQQGISCEAVDSLATAAQLLRDLQPRLCVVGTAEDPDAIGLALIDQCRRENRVSLGLVDGPANLEWRFRGEEQSSLAYAPDWLIVPDEGTRQGFIKLGMPTDRVSACGHPLYDRLRTHRRGTAERQKLRAMLWPDAGDRPVLVFLSELSTGLDPAQFQRSADYTLVGDGHSCRRTDIVLEEILRVARQLHPSPYVVLRLHPKMTEDDVAIPTAGVDAVSKTGAVQDVLEAADAIVGMTSVALDEALVLEKPVLSVLPRICEASWSLGVNCGLIPVATSRAELTAWLPKILAGEKPDQQRVKSGLPSGASARIARLIADIAGSVHV